MNEKLLSIYIPTYNREQYIKNQLGFLLNEMKRCIIFQHGYIPTPYSIYEGIYKLEAGTILKINVNNFCRTSKVY